MSIRTYSSEETRCFSTIRLQMIIQDSLTVFGFVQKSLVEEVMSRAIASKYAIPVRLPASYRASAERRELRESLQVKAELLERFLQEDVKKLKPSG